MRRLDSLVVRELFGPWAFGVAMFTTLLVAATYLGRVSEFLASGVPANVVLEYTLLLLPAILVKTFAMATLLAGLLGLGRLSGDSEVVALRAAGASLWRILLPVAVFSFLAAAAAFFANEAYVPVASKRVEILTKQLARSSSIKSSQPIAQPQFDDDGKLKLMIAARTFSLAERVLEGVTLVAYDSNQEPQYVVTAPRLRWNGRDDWTVEGGARITSLDGGTVVRVNSAWPAGTSKITATPEDLASPKIDNPDFFSMGELKRQIDLARRTGTMTAKAIRNREFWYWNKIALPLATLVFGLLGAALGVRNARTAPAAGFALAIAIIFIYFTLTNFLSIWANEGTMPPAIASFAPIALGLVAAFVVAARKNR